METVIGVNCTKKLKGLGMLDCFNVEGIPDGVLFVPKSWRLLKTALNTFNKTYIKDKLKSQEFLPIVGSFGFEADYGSNNEETSNTGIKQIALEGKPYFTFIFKKGYPFHSALYSLHRQTSYDCLFVFDGSIWACDTADGLGLKGFDVGQIMLSNYEMSNGSVDAQTKLMFQILNVVEYNQRGLALTGLDFDQSDLTGVIDLDLAVRADVSDAKIYVKASWVHNPAKIVSEIPVSNFRFSVNSVFGTPSSVTPPVYNSVTKEYEITPTTPLTAGQLVVVTTYDSLSMNNTIETNNKFYLGESLAVQSVA